METLRQDSLNMTSEELEEMAKNGVTGPGFHLHSEIVIPYILQYGTEEQKQTWHHDLLSSNS